MLCSRSEGEKSNIISNFREREGKQLAADPPKVLLKEPRWLDPKSGIICVLLQTLPGPFEEAKGNQS